MLFVLSAAPTFNAKPVVTVAKALAPLLAAEAKTLVAAMRRREAKLSDVNSERLRDIKKHMHVNNATAKLYQKHVYSAMSSPAQRLPTAPAVCLYDSPLYRRLDVETFAEDDAEWANEHIRILSGTYGLVRPFDAIQPLAPGSLLTKINFGKGKGRHGTSASPEYLRDFWRESIAKELEKTLRSFPEPLVVDCAADGDKHILHESNLPSNVRLTSVEFRMGDGSVSAAASAKGEFVRWALDNRCESFEELHEFRGVYHSVEPAMAVKPTNRKGGSIVFQENRRARTSEQEQLQQYMLHKQKQKGSRKVHIF